MTSVALSAQKIKAEALRLGFNACGVSPAAPVERSHRERLARFAASGEMGEMSYLGRNTEVRSDPRVLVPGARSVVSVALSYYPSVRLPRTAPQLSFYAYGKDYHEVMRKRLTELLNRLKTLYVEKGGQEETFEGRPFCDTAPLPERYWAVQAGLGWIGHNTQLIIPSMGSYFFLGELVLTVGVDAYDRPLASGCGNCRRCVDACPMKALVSPGHLDARRCLSYLTIEQRGPLPPSAVRAMGRTLYGCDCCQKVCPHNRKPIPTGETDFSPSPALLGMTDRSYRNLTHEEWCALFRGSAVKRAKYEGFMRNVRAVVGEEKASPKEEKEAESSSSSTPEGTETKNLSS